MIYKKVPLINVSDYLTYIKYNSKKEFQFDIVRNNITNIQVLGHNLASDIPETQNHNDYIILAYFEKVIRDSEESKRRLKFSNKYHFQELIEENGAVSYYIRIEKDLNKLHGVLKFLFEEVYQFRNSEFYHVSFYEINSATDIRPVTHFKMNLIKRFFRS